MFIKRLAAIGAATVALAGVGAGVASAGPVSATGETYRWCAQDWSGHWHICLVQETDPDGSQWYYAHGWNDVHQYIIVDLLDGDWNWLDTASAPATDAWAATRRYQQGRHACIYDAIHRVEFVCAPE